MEQDQRDIIGYSITDPDAKARWKELVSAIESHLQEHGLQEDVVFHGTSASRVGAVMVDGLEPHELDTAVIVTVEQDGTVGSFWGTVRTAAAYAEDTARERDACSPALLMACAYELETCAELRPDLATLDFPLKGLTRLDDDGVMDRWIAGYAGFSWREGLRDLGAVVAMHDSPVPARYMTRIDSFDDYLRAVGEKLPGPGLRIGTS